MTRHCTNPPSTCSPWGKGATTSRRPPGGSMRLPPLHACTSLSCNSSETSDLRRPPDARGARGAALGGPARQPLAATRDHETRRARRMQRYVDFAARHCPSTAVGDPGDGAPICCCTTSRWLGFVAGPGGRTRGDPAGDCARPARPRRVASAALPSLAATSAHSPSCSKHCASRRSTWSPRDWAHIRDCVGRAPPGTCGAWCWMA